MHSFGKGGVLVLVAALIVVLGVLRPVADTPKTEASLAYPGGIAALPTSAPAVPGLTAQGTPAVIGTGQPGIVVAFCFGPIGVPLVTGPCSEVQESDETVNGYGWISFKLERLLPLGGGLPGLTFDANGSDSLIVTDNSGADMDAAQGVVTVRVNAAAATQAGTQGLNEVVIVTATDESGDTRTAQIFVVDTILGVGPTGPLSTASQEQPVFVAYHCPVTGRAPLAEGSLPWAIDPDGDGVQGLDDMYDGYYTKYVDVLGPGLGYGSNTLAGDLDLPDVWCGGNTPSLADDFVDFQTDLGLLSIDPLALTLQEGSILLASQLSYFYPPIVDTDCASGKSVNIADVDALSSWASWITGGFASKSASGLEGGCDGDGWRNGVVTAMLLGNGEVGTATITAQQGGGVSLPRTVNVTFVGEPALSLVFEAPPTIGVEGGDVTVILLDSDIRPVADETISCTLAPVDSGMVIVPQTGTTGAATGDLPGMVVMKIVPTGAAVAAGGTLTLTCRLDRQPSVTTAAVIKLAATESESVKLLPGCNPVVATWPDDTPIETVVKAVLPANALDAVWTFDVESSAWLGYSTAAPEASDLKSVMNLQAMFVCMTASGTISRPVI
jgi:hypothetical protein